MTEHLEGDKAAEPEQEPEEPGKWLTALQSFVLLAMSAGAIVYLGDWRFLRTPQQQTVQISFVSSPVVAPVPPPPPKPKEVEKKPAPPPKPTAAEIALKKKLEKEAEDKKRREDEEKKRKAKEAEQKKKDDRERKRLKAAAEKERLKQDKLDAQRKADAAAKAAARATALAGLQKSYLGRIKNVIERHLQTPPSARGEDDLLVVVEVRLDTDGTLLGLPSVLESSDLPDYDEAAVRAVLKASPFDMPREPELLEEFRILTLHITPQ